VPKGIQIWSGCSGVSAFYNAYVPMGRLVKQVIPEFEQARKCSSFVQGMVIRGKGSSAKIENDHGCCASSSIEIMEGWITEP